MTAPTTTPVHQAARVIVGHCPECTYPVVLLNNYESWPLAACRCGWAGGSTELVGHHRLEATR